MKPSILLLAFAVFIGTVTIAQARDLGPDEALRLRDAGTIKSFEQLNELALAQHPGGRIEETELEDEYGRYIYQIELRDAQGVQWDLELDASTGAILKHHQDD
ncbi:Peptidase [Pseudomonas sp. 8Z]|uniref:PepSY domain-containing protein n=1 Tax=Pseudomonas sp. 8Z TaxID=2653166 RepID=UPI0012F05D5E|nr:PepSY domain-containing protein [Pseudomonas sp. 8Z]VXC43477.1 Peptidase [Pseudomonas sp. 8Z]